MRARFKIIIVLFSALSPYLSVNAQYNRDYVEMRDEAKALFAKGEYSAALSLYEGAYGFASSNIERDEIASLRRVLQDSVSSLLNRSISLARKAKTKVDYSYALQSFKQLFPIERLYVPMIFSWMGYCYEHLSEPYGAIEQYELGLKRGESYSIKKLAKLLPRYKQISSDSIASLYLIIARNDKTAYDNVGDLLLKDNPAKAYYYYKKSETQYGRYQMACLQLESRVTATEDPIEILKGLSKEKYADAQYYMGLIYFHGTNRVKQDETIGLGLIESAASNGCAEAKQWLKERNRELNRLKYSSR